ncbi:S16 family serine protease [Streptococcus acidominimus]|uniref:Lon protease n=1 Tax=Streptococcus acidominimus TaxID=1326 RepID=A0A1Q8EBH4_STRAI|nr:S16 family serine protease [Streptococcus acidominimus]OLF49143.1 hypothetical protein BU200_08885 [Streptococcus acidominimus]SUN06884.1 Lon protease [Streptococcus acidominimus]
MRVYVPGVHDSKQVRVFEVQCVPIVEPSLDIVTGNVNNEIYDSCFVALTLLRTNKLLPENQRFHIHFTDSELLKSGPSAGLGVFLKLLSMDVKSDMNLIVTGELDLSGNVIEVGGFYEKLEYYCKNSLNFDGFIVPTSNFKDIEDKLFCDKLEPISHISEIRGVLNEIITDNIHN